jgi:sulfonate transport system permease protein
MAPSPPRPTPVDDHAVQDTALRIAPVVGTPGTAPGTVAPPPGRVGPRRVRRSLLPASSRDVAITVVVLVLAWQLVAGVLADGGVALSSPVEVAGQGWADRELLLRNVWATVQVAVAGFAVGNLLAVALAVGFVLSPLVDRVLSQFALALYALPTLVLAPILEVFLDPQSTRITVAALVVFFPTLVNTATGLRSATAETVDLVRSLGGSRWTVLYRVRLRGALPGVFSGLRVAVPGALLGAIASEWLGADTGLGIFMVNALGYLNTARVYACVVVCVLLTVTGYALVSLANRAVNGWHAAEGGRR